MVFIYTHIIVDDDEEEAQYIPPIYVRAIADYDMTAGFCTVFVFLLRCQN